MKVFNDRAVQLEYATNAPYGCVGGHDNGSAAAKVATQRKASDQVARNLVKERAKPPKGHDDLSHPTATDRRSAKRVGLHSCI